MSLVLRFNLLRNNIGSSCPVRFLKQYSGLSSGNLFDPRRYEKRHLTTTAQTLETKFSEAASWPKPSSSLCIPGIQSLWLQQTSEHDQPGPVLVFDIETTGFLHKDHRIIEFALRDLSGGKNCTFETLINPERDIPSIATSVHKISTDLVCRPDVPRFDEVLPTLLAYVRSRQVPGKPVLWVAHNAKQFDAPFLAQEFDRCKVEIPADWFIVDSLPLAKKVMRAVATEKGEKKFKSNLEAMAKHYGISCDGPAHRAMADATKLCQVFQKLTFDLKLSCEGLMNEAVRANTYSKVSN